MIKASDAEYVAMHIKLIKAIVEAHKDLEPVIKDATNPFHKSQYETLSAILSEYKRVFLKHGLCVVQVTEIINGKMLLKTILMHIDGGMIESFYEISPDKTGPQALGAAITYARRYALKAILSMSSADDDGESAEHRPKQTYDAIPVSPSNPAPKVQLKFKNGLPAPKYPIEDIPAAAKAAEEFLNTPWPDEVQNFAPKTTNAVLSTPSDEFRHSPKLNAYVITFGKFKDRQMIELPLNEVTGYADYLQRNAVKDNKALVGGPLKFVEMSELYRQELLAIGQAKYKNQDLEKDTPSFDQDETLPF